MGYSRKCSYRASAAIVIAKRELLSLRAKWGIDSPVIEKDYVLGWLLAAIASEPALTKTWIFKGGTCLRKCYYETYRLSEDLDFTVIEGGIEEPAGLSAVFKRIGGWLQAQAGIELFIDDHTFIRRRNTRGNPTTQGRIAFRGPNPPPVLPKLKIDITSDELLVEPPVRRPIVHHFSDGPLPVEGAQCYSITEIMAEKTRALTQRCRPRDLYDVVHLLTHPELVGQREQVAATLALKCAYVDTPVPNLDTLNLSPYRDEIETEWKSMLAHQLPAPLAPFEQFWSSLHELFEWLDGEDVSADTLITSTKD